MMKIKYTRAMFLYRDLLKSLKWGNLCSPTTVIFNLKALGRDSVLEIHMCYLKNDATTLERGLKVLQKCKCCITIETPILTTSNIKKTQKSSSRGMSLVALQPQMDYRGNSTELSQGHIEQECCPECRSGVKPSLCKRYVSERYIFQRRCGSPLQRQ